MTEKYDEWRANSVHEYTSSDNVKVPPRKKIVQWILDSRKEFDEEIFIKLFKASPLNLNVDESEYLLL